MLTDIAMLCLNRPNRTVTVNSATSDRIRSRASASSAAASFSARIVYKGSTIRSIGGLVSRRRHLVRGAEEGYPAFCDLNGKSNGPRRQAALFLRAGRFGLSDQLSEVFELCLERFAVCLVMIGNRQHGFTQ